MVQWTSDPARKRVSVQRDGIALCLHAVQLCGRKVIQGNESDVSDDSALLSDKNCN
jgi:hypothetical protein